MMDLGCYGLHAQRVLAPWGGGEPSLVGARAEERAGAPGVDEWLAADLVYPSGATGLARCHMASDRWEMSCRIIGSRAEATAVNFVQPHLDDRVLVRTPEGSRVEHLGVRSSYTYQLEAFINAVRGGLSMPTDADDAVNIATSQDGGECSDPRTAAATAPSTTACQLSASISARALVKPGRVIRMDI